ncbi:hypothetical protein Zmor_012869 [Zophobas morio]|uniref:CHK kinase-like domain-containing protein n=1 Tax=Zophobas morio TaxID=2755281 RepID=A0AA38IEC1_9CUCU|nr:hypothetical protein Zmor_012869 [Zophobas morio]
MNNCALTRDDCDLIAKKHFHSDDVITTNFALRPLEDENFELNITIYHGKTVTTIPFFVKTGPNEAPTLDTNFSPKLYLKKHNLAVYEDLRQDFETRGRLLNTEELQIVLKTLAAFHASNFVSELDHSNFDLESPTVTSLLSSVLENDDQVSKTIQNLRQKQLESKFRRTLCHGNLTNRNLMFKNDKGAPTECRLLNFKANFCVPPIYDVLQLIFFNTSEDLRRCHFQALLNCYYECLKEETTKGDLDVTVDDFRLSAHYYLPVVKLQAALHHQNETSVQELKESLACPLVSREDCYVIVKNKTGTTNYKLLSYNVTPLSDVSGFLGQYYRLEIKIRLQSEDTTINCFIKALPKTATPLSIVNDLNSFSREIFMYETVVTQMKNHKINIIDECLPPCYFVRPKEFMIFEDMAFLGYKNLDVMDPLDITMLTLLMKTLAKFHACSLTLEEKAKPYSLYNSHKEYFTEPLFFEDDKHKGAKLTTVGVKAVLTAVNLLKEIQTETNQRNFYEFWPKFKELYYELPKPSARFQNVLCHADLWTSNFMVKYDNDKAVNCVFFDFQIARYCPPAYDLLSMLHLTTDRSTRLKYENQLIKVYYDELDRILNSYEVNIGHFYSFDDFVECFNSLRPHMLMHAAYECTMLTCTPEEISSFLSDEEACSQVFFEDRTEFMTIMCQKSDLYRNRLKECILDIYDYCDSMCGK